MLGSANTTTTVSGGATYSGSYRVLGDLVLTNGTYILNTGTVFYVDGQASKTPQRQVTGAAIILGANANLVLDGATITASGTSTSCPMWRGIVVKGNGRAPGSTKPRIIIQNGSMVSHAWCGLGTDGYPTWDYAIENSTFANNLTHVRDNAGHDGQTVSVITGSTFDSDPAKMHYPYEQTTAGDKYYTYEALYLTPLTSTAFVHTVEVQGNTINNAVYGIVNNQFDRAGVWIENNTLNKILLIGIWTVNNDTGVGRSGPMTSGNVIAMNNVPGLNTDQVDPAATRYGILGEYGTWHYNSFVNNVVAGNNGMTYNQIGISISGQTDVRGNWVQQVNEGISATNLDNTEVVDNRTSDCTRGLVPKSDGNGMNQVYRLGCNSFEQGSGLMSSTPVGITLENGATINDIGSFSAPAANRFDGLAYALENNSSSQLTYYQTNSSQENVNVGGTGGVNVLLYTVFMRSKAWSSYCLNNGAPNGNGVNQARGAAPSAGYIAALMDSVRQQLVPPARARGYLHEVLSYHASTKQLPALEAWWATLAAPNAGAYRTAGLYLLNAYDAQRATADAQRIVLALQPAALLNAELAAQLQLRAVLRHVTQTTPRLVAADSVALRTLAWSGTSVAAQAAYWLRYFHPRIALPAATPVAPLRPAATAARKTVLAERGATLGAAYPNPAQTEVTISCQLAQAGQAAELRFVNLLTGQVALVVPVAGTGTERRQQVALAGLPAGQYAYQLVVEGRLAAAPQKLFVNP